MSEATELTGKVYTSANQPMPVQPEPTLTPDQERFTQLLNQRGVSTGTHHAIWTKEEIAIVEQARKEVYGPKPVSTDTGISNQTTVITESEAREVLRIAIAKRVEAEHDLSVANGAVTRAQVRVQEYSDQINDFTGLDEEIVQHNVQAIRDDKEPVLPAALLHRQTQRGKVADRFAAAQAAFDRLTQEARTMETKAVQARNRVSQGAGVVMQINAEQLVSAITDLEAQAKQLRSNLLSFSSTWLPIGTGPKPVQVSQAVTVLLRDPPINLTAAPDPAIVAHFQEVHARLCSDADATLG